MSHPPRWQNVSEPDELIFALLSFYETHPKFNTAPGLLLILARIMTRAVQSSIGWAPTPPHGTPETAHQ